jgi:hypothetical protein
LSLPAPAEPDFEKPAEPTVAATLRAERVERTGGWFGLDRLPSRQRNQLCIAIIALGAINFLIYTLSYAALGGDAQNGYCKVVEDANGTHTEYYVRGHFIHYVEGRAQAVSRAAWIYSHVHSISVPLTSGAMIISMLVLARPHILATMRGGFMTGQTFVVAFGTVVVLVSISVALMFTVGFIRALS